MESNELFLASPGTDFDTGRVSIGGYLPNGTKESNLTVDNYYGRVGIGTTTPTSKLEVIGTITATENIIGKTGSFTGTGKPIAPTAAGVYMGLDSSTGGGIEICIGIYQYIDFTIPTTSTPTYDFQGI
jgi:hypothetical protein